MLAQAFEHFGVRAQAEWIVGESTVHDRLESCSKFHERPDLVFMLLPINKVEAVDRTHGRGTGERQIDHIIHP